MTWLCQFSLDLDIPGLDMVLANSTFLYHLMHLILRFFLLKTMEFLGLPIVKVAHSLLISTLTLILGIPCFEHYLITFELSVWVDRRWYLIIWGNVLIWHWNSVQIASLIPLLLIFTILLLLNHLFLLLYLKLLLRYKVIQSHGILDQFLVFDLHVAQFGL